MITFKNGEQRTRKYEETPHLCKRLSQLQDQFNHQLGQLAGVIYLSFKELQDDYKAGNIEKHIYHEHLKKFIPYLKENSAPYIPELKGNEILEALEKEGIDWQAL